MNNIVVSPCSNPELDLDEALEAYSRINYHKFEAFTSWVKSALDWRNSPEYYAEKARNHAMSFYALHLPPVTEPMEETLARAVDAARFAGALGARVVLFKADTRERYVQAARPFLDRTESFGVTPVLQNHAGAAISTLADFAEVLEGIDDPRMKALLEVGHFHTVGTSWEEGCDLLGDTIAYVHIKDQIGAQSVPFGTGEIDLAGLFRHMAKAGYEGHYVIEMEVADRENTIRYLADALAYVQSLQTCA